MKERERERERERKRERESVCVCVCEREREREPGWTVCPTTMRAGFLLSFFVFGVWGLGFGVWGLGFGILGLGFGVGDWSLHFMVWVGGLRV